MNRRNRFCIYLLLLVTFAPAWASVSEVSLDKLAPTRAHRQAAFFITKVVGTHHYRKVPLDDAFSRAILERYLESLDSNRSFFTREDLEAFSVFGDQLDDALRRTQLNPAFQIFRIFRERVDDYVTYALNQLDEKQDFTLDEAYRFDRSEAPWAEDRKALREIWRKRVKNDILSLQLAGKKAEGIRETLTKRYEGFLRRTHQLSADDVFQTFINAYTFSLEPHTSYMSPRTAENFDISMSLSLEGIGAVLRTKNEHTLVVRTVPGGPAALSGRVKTGDRIVGVAQDDDGEMVDVVGWRLQDVVDMIRGRKGSVVRLDIIPKDASLQGAPSEITLVRNKIKLEDQAAQKSVIEGLEELKGSRIGVIEVPTFYRDFRAYSRGDKDFRSTTRDVRKLLGELEADGVDGIVIDLRQNGGGSLSEATELTGLFIKTGPVVQVKASDGELQVEKDADPEVAYSGPLAVLVDRDSASASEIFAGAIQDYGRGMIIGEPTFGKGTVQTLVNLDRLVVAGTEHLGRLRLTTAQFFRINGESTQFKGVVPDIIFPTASSSSDHGERALDNALPWAEIKPAVFRPVHFKLADKVRKLSERRIESDEGFRFLIEEQEALNSLREKHSISLLESRRKQEREEEEKKFLENRNRFRVAQGLKPLAGYSEEQDGEIDMEIDEEEDEKIKRIQVDETARILADQIRLSRATRLVRVEKEGGGVRAEMR